MDKLTDLVKAFFGEHQPRKPQPKPEPLMPRALYTPPADFPALLSVEVEKIWYNGQVIKHKLNLKFMTRSGPVDLLIGQSSDGAKMEELAQDIREELGI